MGDSEPATVRATTAGRRGGGERRPWLRLRLDLRALRAGAGAGVCGGQRAGARAAAERQSGRFFFLRSATQVIIVIDLYLHLLYFQPCLQRSLLTSLP